VINPKIIPPVNQRDSASVDHDRPGPRLNRRYAELAGGPLLNITG